MENTELLECIPNISYGWYDDSLKDIIQTINNISEQKLIHFDNNEGANRTVLTFVGNKSGIRKALLKLFEQCSQIIDMRYHQGAHPRIGMVDVCPIVPLQGISLEETITFTKELSQEIASRFNIPIYSYEHCQYLSHRKFLPQIRKGGYEGLLEKMKLPEWAPDYGPLPDSEENITSIQKHGATVLGVRPILIAYNISIDTKDTQIAKKLAAEIRTIGDGKGNKGKFKALRAIGWYIPEFGHAQISMNFLNYKITSPIEVYEYLEERLMDFDIQLLGSELVGLIPQKVLIDAGIKQANKLHKTNISDEDLFNLGADYLQLNAVKTFIPKEHILEQLIHHKMGIDVKLS